MSCCDSAWTEFPCPLGSVPNHFYSGGDRPSVSGFRKPEPKGQAVTDVTVYFIRISEHPSGNLL